MDVKLGTSVLTRRHDQTQWQRSRNRSAFSKLLVLWVQLRNSTLALTSHGPMNNSAAHRLGQAAVPLPVILVGAGLPSLPAQLADATSYAERLYDYRSIGLLDPAAAEAALVQPPDGTFLDDKPYTVRYRDGSSERYRIRFEGRFLADGVVGTLRARMQTRKKGKSYYPCDSGTQTWSARA